MILVRNHHQQLSGNNSWLIWLLCLLTISACGVSAPRTTGREVLKPVPETTEANTEEKKEVPVEKIEEKEVIVRSFFERPNSLNVLILAPFEDESRSERFVEFYQGFKQMAESDITNLLNYNLRVDALNCNHNASSILIEKKIDEADIVIGPYYPEDIKRVSEMVANKNKILLSPWTPNQNQKMGEHYIQLSAGLDQHLEAMTAHALRSYLPSKILLVGKSSDQSLFEQINDSLITTYGYGSKLESFEVEDVNDRNMIKELSKVIQEKEIEALIVPHWRKPSFLMTLMGRLNVLSNQKIKEEKEEDTEIIEFFEKDPVKVYCLGRLLMAKNLDYSTLENLDLLITSTKGDHFDTEKSHSFRRNYFANNYISPGKEAYLGHDTYVLMNQLVMDLFVGQQPDKELVCEHCFNKVVLSDQGRKNYDMSMNPIQLNAENIGVELLQFKGYRFTSIDE